MKDSAIVLSRFFDSLSTSRKAGGINTNKGGKIVFFKKKTKSKDTIEDTLASLHTLVLEAAEIVRLQDTSLSNEEKQKLSQLRMEVREAHQSLELIDYCLKQKE